MICDVLVLAVTSRFVPGWHWVRTERIGDLPLVQ